MLTNLFIASDGKIPYVQIIVGIVIGAIGMLIYAKFFKPQFILDTLNDRKSKSATTVKQQQQQQQKKSSSKSNPVVLDLHTLAHQNATEKQPISMPKFPTLSTLSTVSQEDDDDDDEDDEDDESENVEESDDEVSPLRGETREENVREPIVNQNISKSATTYY